MQLVQAAVVLAAAVTTAAANFTMSQAGSDFQEGTVQPPVEQIKDDTTSSSGSTTVGQSSTTGSTASNGDYMAPFSTDEPSDLFQRYDTLTTLAPIINVASDLLTQPLPTNKWWGNLIHTTAEDIDTVANPAWSNPYALKLPKEAPYGLQACYSYTYRSMADEVDGVVKYYLHAFHNDLTLSATEFASTKPDYEIYSFSDMGASVRTCVSGSDSCMDSSLVNGMAFVSATYSGLTASIESEYAMTLVDDSTAGKYVIQLPNKQTWVVYSSDASATFSIDSTGSALVSSTAYTGTLRVAILPDSSAQSVYDDYSSCVIRGGNVSVESRTSYSLQWETEGSGCDSTGLLHFALPHQVEVLADATTMQTSGAIILHSSTRGQMVGQVTTSGSWKLTEDEADNEVDFYPANKPSADIVSQINLLSTLKSDIDSDWSLDTGSWYYNGKAYQKYASLCLMAADSSIVGNDTTLLSSCLSKLEKLVEPFLSNTLGSPLAYETAYKGIVTSQVFTANNADVEFGNGVYNDHHYHYGYWVTASAILKKLDPSWSGMAQLENMVWTLLRDVANPSSDDTYFPKFRHFSWFLGHSYSHGVTPMADGKDEESTSEDVNFFYGMMLWGKVTGKKAVEDLGSLMLRLNARAVRTYFLMTSDNTIHPPQFVPNHVTGIFFDNKADYATWFSAEKYCIHGIQMIPVSPINGLVRTKKFIQEEWDDILSKEAIVTGDDTTNAWLSLLLVNEAVINQDDALAKLATATMDDGLTRSWALYNAASRGGSSSSGSTSTIVTEAPDTPEVTTATPSVTTSTPTVTSTPPTATTATPTATTATPVATTATPVATAITPATTATPVATTATPVATAITPATTATPTVTTCTPSATVNPKTGVTTSSSWKDTVGQF
ncbi:putative endo-1 [Phytophthora citrophthora]|uniref:glucan endo-1,3-beta-D-glucosidase n=1 Tax=Phytophthora citrophthora TaxID=4793 RepID=A0AAD9H0Q4_9STRA|nr:putative endo-1 [Phytophthora citrophthora]